MAHARVGYTAVQQTREMQKLKAIDYCQEVLRPTVHLHLAATNRDIGS